jgi:hypothetical protein
MSETTKLYLALAGVAAGTFIIARAVDKTSSGINTAVGDIGQGVGAGVHDFFSKAGTSLEIVAGGGVAVWAIWLLLL